MFVGCRETAYEKQSEPEGNVKLAFHPAKRSGLAQDAAKMMIKSG